MSNNQLIENDDVQEPEEYVAVETPPGEAEGEDTSVEAEASEPESTDSDDGDDGDEDRRLSEEDSEEEDGPQGDTQKGVVAVI